MDHQGITNNAILIHPVGCHNMLCQPWKINTQFNCFTHIISFHSHKNPYRWGTIVPILEVKKLRLRKTEEPAPDAELPVVQQAFKLDQSHAWWAKAQNMRLPECCWPLWLGPSESKHTLVPAPSLTPKDNMLHFFKI